MTLSPGALLLLATASTLFTTSKGRLAVGSACGGSLIGQGVFSTSNYPSSPISGQVCQWTLTAFKGKIITIFFDDFDIGPGSFLDVYDGTSAVNSSKLTTYSGSSAALTTLTLNSTATLIFRNAQLSQSRGFLLAFYSSCLYTRSATDVVFVNNATLIGGGSFSTPGDGGWYPNSARYTWMLRACEDGASLKLVFKSFSLESPYDSVTIYDGSSPTDSNIVGSYSGDGVPDEITLGTVAIVVFTSDNMIASSGFSATFSTVIGDRKNATDPSSLPRACSASCPLVLQEDARAYCYAHDDPHMMTFDAKTYEMQKEGIFYLYKHDNAPIWVQAAFQTCNRVATCSCAVGVRFWDEVFVVDRCALAGSTYRPDRAYKLGNGSMMSIEKRGVGYMVTLPNGLKVYIGGTWAWIGAVDLRTVTGDRNAVQGLCGLYNGNPADDGTYRCGFDPEKVKSSWETWRVPAAESVFSAVTPFYQHKISSCNCSNVRRNYTLPPGVIDATSLGVPASELSDGSRFDVQIGSAGGGENAPWPGSWTQATATTFCTNYIAQNPAIDLCSKTLGGILNVGMLINDCVRDIYLTGSTNFALTALEASKEQCLAALQQNNITSKPILALLCPNECFGKGTCQNGTCVCKAGYFGLDCSIDPSIPPVLRNSSASSECTDGGFCKWEVIFGETFYDVVAKSPKCRIRATVSSLSSTGSLGAASLVSTVIIPAIYDSHSMVRCQLQEPSSNATAAVLFTYVISVSNDGVNYSNPVETYRTYTPPCGGLIVGFGRVSSPNYPTPYWSNAACNWTLIAATDRVVELYFATFFLEDGPDILSVYDQGLLVDTFTGSQQKRKITYGRSVTLQFNSNLVRAAKGFSIDFKSAVKGYACAASPAGAGTLISPNYPANYPSNAYCLWTLSSAAGGKRLRLRFNVFKLEEGYDSVTVYSGSRLVDSFNGYDVPPDMILNSTVSLLFRSDVDTEFSGFNISYATLD